MCPLVCLIELLFLRVVAAREGSHFDFGQVGDKKHFVIMSVSLSWQSGYGRITDEGISSCGAMGT